jgi:hypothetical protein
MHDHDVQRRMLLRMLAAGCAMSIPLVGRAKPAGSAAAKISQAQAQYQNHPKADQKCANCGNFLPPASCKLVEGKISPDGWCVLWVKKQA